MGRPETLVERCRRTTRYGPAVRRSHEAVTCNFDGNDFFFQVELRIRFVTCAKCLQIFWIDGEGGATRIGSTRREFREQFELRVQLLGCLP